MLKVEPHKNVLPLVGYEQSQDSTPVFLGTSFFVETTSGPLLATVNHIIKDWNGCFGILAYPDPTIHTAELIAQHPEVDLALLYVPECCPKKPLKIAHDDELLINQLVNCYEYSGSRFFKEAGAHTAALSSSRSCR
jgi:S1-C subfamily serine protease